MVYTETQKFEGRPAPVGEGTEAACGPDRKPRTPIKVLMLTDSFLPHAGGSREYYNNIYRALVNLGGYAVTVQTNKVPGWKEFDRHARSEFFRIVRSSRPLKSLKYSELPKGATTLLSVLKRVVIDRPDIIHAGDLYPQGLTAMFLKLSLGLPYIVYCHGEEITQMDKFRFQPAMRDRIYRNADGVIANSEFATSNLIRIGVTPDRICKITPGVDCHRFRPMSPSKVLLDRYGLAGKTVILTVARLVPRKGHRIALEAFAQVASEFPDAHYLIVGTGPEETTVRRMVQQFALEHRVTFAGFVPNEDLPDLYNLSEVMLLPNRQEPDGDVEGFGIVFLEANASGKAVIGGRSGGAVEAIAEGESGFLVDPDDSHDIASALRRLLSDPALRARMGKYGLIRSQREFAWSNRAQLLDDLNCRILGTQNVLFHARAATAEKIIS